MLFFSQERDISLQAITPTTSFAEKLSNFKKNKILKPC